MRARLIVAAELRLAIVAVAPVAASAAPAAAAAAILAVAIMAFATMARFALRLWREARFSRLAFIGRLIVGAGGQSRVRVAGVGLVAGIMLRLRFAALRRELAGLAGLTTAATPPTPP